MSRATLWIMFFGVISFIGCSSISFANPAPQSFREIFFAHKDNTSDKWDPYLDIYQDQLSKLVDKSPVVLEIGVQNGGFLQILKKYLHNAKVYGVDINPKVCKLNLGDAIITMCFDATNKEQIAKNLNNLQFDLIIDDASHISADVISTFRLLFPQIKPGGVYLIEDLHAAYWKFYKGGYPSTASSMEYLKNWVDGLNYYHIADKQAFLKTLNADDKNILAWLGSISFYDSVAVITKLSTPRTGNMKRAVAGVNEPIAKVS